MTERSLNATGFVILIVDPFFGARLQTQIGIAPVWIVESPGNRAIAEQLRLRYPVATDAMLLTVFKGDIDATGADRVLAILGTVAEHHGTWSTDGHELTMTALRVIGAEATRDVAAACRDYGLPHIAATEQGFMAQCDA